MHTLPLLLSMLVGCGEAPPPEVSADVPSSSHPSPEPAPTEPSPAPAVPVDQLVTGPRVGAADFGAALYGQLAGKGDNVFFSPASVQLALGMTLAGARGDTAAEMVGALHLPEAPHEALGERYRSWVDASGPVELAVANRVWVADDLTLEPAFEAAIATHYGSGVKPTSFADPEAARERINGWVAEQTRDRIEDLLAPGVLKSSTTMVLTNAIYFLGNWEDAFDPGATHEAPFHTASGDEVPVPLMSRTGRYRFGARDGVQLLELPYEGGRYRMIAVMPEEGTDLAAVEARLDAAGLDALRAAASSQEVKVFLPRFEVETTYDLVAPMQALGMTRAFTGSADFSGMGPAGQPISAIVHKAFVKVDEKGTEAAAATAVVMLRGAKPAPKVFRADRPFVFAIWDDATQAPLFIGRFARP